MSEMLMAIFLVYSTSGITSSKKVFRKLEMAAIDEHLMNRTTFYYVSINTFFYDQYLAIAIQIKHVDCMAY